MNNSWKESTAEQQERKNSRDLVAAHNRSNSSLASGRSRRSFAIRSEFDMSSLIDREEFPQSTVGIGKHQFNYQYVIGKGGFGKVWSVEFKKNRKIGQHEGNDEDEDHRQEEHYVSHERTTVAEHTEAPLYREHEN